MSKSENKIKFAETDGDFVDFLVSFLTTSLGSILNLMNGRVSLGSIPNLYASVKNLDSSCFLGSSKKSLLNPGVAPQFGCKSIQVSALQEVHTPKYWYGVKGGTNSDERKISKIRDMLRDPAEMKLFEPRCCDGARERAIGFMKRPCTFVVSDDLEVKTIANGTTTTTNATTSATNATTSATNATTSTTSSIKYLQQIQNLHRDGWSGLRIHSVKITKSHKVLNLLMTSLTPDKAVLTRNLFYPFKWKIQKLVLFWKKKKKSSGKN
ncbi:hypothetical protein Fmac_010512 [Flemingia macrophylla]|uniref:Uncharacterized protein n=1 Tax=Flemingia macrophylla TaxID=520843 RepID=A0ABD1MJS6_9FABA